MNLFIVVIALSGWAANNEEAGDPQQPSDATVLGQIRAEFRERSQAFRTMRIKYRVMPPPDKQGKYRSDVEPKKFEWVVSGSKQLLKREPWKDTRAAQESPQSPDSMLPPSPEWESFDGTTGYQIVFWPKNPDTISRIFHVRELPESLRRNQLPVHFGLRLPYSSIQFFDQLEQPGAAMLGRESVGDAKCVKVRLASFEPTPGLKHDLIAWFDKDYDFVLRKLQLNPVRLRDHPPGTVENPIRREPGEISLNTYAATVIAAHDPVQDKKRWFPASWAVMPGRLPYSVIDEIALNQNVDANEFVPVPTVGAEIIDMTKKDKGAESYVVGGEEGLALKQKNLKQNIVEGLQQSKPIAETHPTTVVDWNAHPPTKSWLPRLVWLVALFCFLTSIGIVYWRRHAS